MDEKNMVTFQISPRGDDGLRRLSIGCRFIDVGGIEDPLSDPTVYAAWSVSLTSTQVVALALGLVNGNVAGATASDIAELLRAVCKGADVRALPALVRELSLVIADMAHAILLSEDISKWVDRNAALHDALAEVVPWEQHRRKWDEEMR